MGLYTGVLMNGVIIKLRTAWTYKREGLYTEKKTNQKLCGSVVTALNKH